MAQYIGEAREAITESLYILNTNANESARGEKPRLKEYLTYTNIGTHRRERNYLCKLMTEVDPSFRVTSVALLPSEVLRTIPNLVQLRIRFRRVQEEFGVVVLLGLIIIRKVD